MTHKFLITATALLSLLIYLHPLLRPKVVAGHDSGYHFTRVQLFSEALKQGQFPVRWTEGPGPGLSHPLFQFYPPLFYYPAAGLMLLGIPYVAAVYLTLAAAAFAGWLGMYLLISQLLIHKSILPPLFSATLFLFTPYRLSQLYVRAAYGEFLATSLLPFIFLGIYNLFNRYKFRVIPRDPPTGGSRGNPEASRKIAASQTNLPRLAERDPAPQDNDNCGNHNSYKSYIILSVSIAAVSVSHQPTLVMAGPVIAGWILLLWFKSKNTSKAVITGSGIAVGLLLAATFLLPLILEQKFIRLSLLSSNYFDFRQHFASVSQLVYSPWGFGISQTGAGDGMSFQIGIINWLVVGAALAAAAYNYYKNYNNYNLYIVFFLAVLLYGIFMSVPLSLPAWERFSILGFIQYPWRFLSISALSTAVLGGITLSSLSSHPNHPSHPSHPNHPNHPSHPSHPNHPNHPSHPSHFLPLLLLLPILFNVKYISPSAYFDRSAFDLKFPVDLSKLNLGNDPLFGVEVGYLPVFVKETNPNPSPEKFILVSGKAFLKPKSTGITRQEFEIAAETPATVRVMTHYFPGWTAIIDGKETVPAFDNPEGFMEIPLPSGKHEVKLQLRKTKTREIADYLSLGAGLGLLSLAAFTLLPKRLRSKYEGAVSAALRYNSNALPDSPKLRK